MYQLIKGRVETLPWQDSRNTGLDAFGRLRVSDPFPLFDCQTQYDKQPFLMDDILVGGGTTTFLPNESSVQLNVTGTVGDKVTRRSRQWIRYQPGKSQQVVITGVLGAPTIGIAQRLGYYDNFNGLYFEQTIAGISIVRRTSVSGSVFNNIVPQFKWNLDTLDGSGTSSNPSKLLLNPNNVIVYQIDFQWLGASRVRWGISFGNRIVYVHEFSASNTLSTVYMGTGNLPVTYELENTGSLSIASMKAICCSVNSEGGIDHGGFIFSQNSILLNIATLVPAISIRPKLTFNSIVNRGQVWLIKCTGIATSTSNPFALKIVRNGVLTGSSFFSQSSNSIVECDISATAITGGDIIDTNCITTSGNVIFPIDLKYPLTLSADGTVQDIFTLTATPLTGAVTSIAGSLSWKELR